MPQGFHASGDILTKTRDGQDLNAIWDGYQSLLAKWNAERQPLVDLLSFPVTNTVEEDVMLPGTEDFEEASEFGVPKAVRPTVPTRTFAYPFKWYDIASRFTFRFLADADARQVDAVNNMVLEADNRLVFSRIMNALFRNDTRSATVSGQPYNVYPLYNGDSDVPPPYKGATFSSGHQHYITSGATDLDPGDIEALTAKVTEHGYDEQSGYTMLVIVNKQEADVIRTWRAGQTYGTASVKALYDFIPSQPAAGSLPSSQSLLIPPGYAAPSQVPNTFAGLSVVGNYGPRLIVEENLIPAGYMLAAATQGRNTNLNLIGLREHANASLRGLILRPGDQSNYPLVNSYYVRGFGAGVRQRGAAAIMQVTASGSYTAPSQYAAG
jgi:hypothetical protein